MDPIAEDGMEVEDEILEEEEEEEEEECDQDDDNINSDSEDSEDEREEQEHNNLERKVVELRKEVKSRFLVFRFHSYPFGVSWRSPSNIN